VGLDAFMDNSVDLYRFDASRPNAMDSNGTPTASAYPSSPDLSALAASVQMDGPSRGGEDQMMDQSVATGKVFFAVNNRIKRNDKLVWIDAASVAHVMFADGQETLAGTDLIWRVPVREVRVR
jgi:hypothetical protein